MTNVGTSACRSSTAGDLAFHDRYAASAKYEKPNGTCRTWFKSEISEMFTARVWTTKSRALHLFPES